MAIMAFSHFLTAWSIPVCLPGLVFFSTLYQLKKAQKRFVPSYLSTYTAWSDEDECNVRSHHKYPAASAHTENNAREGFLSTDNVMQMDGYRQTSEAIEGSVYVRKCRDTKVERKTGSEIHWFSKYRRQQDRKGAEGIRTLTCCQTTNKRSPAGSERRLILSTRRRSCLSNTALEIETTQRQKRSYSMPRQKRSENNTDHGRFLTAIGDHKGLISKITRQQQNNSAEKILTIQLTRLTSKLRAATK